jgi:putative pyruvate formate lyase activating enzyme
VTVSKPGYVRLAESGALAERVDAAASILRSCSLCPRDCGVDRIAGETGYCRAGALPKVFSHSPHPGEEPPLSGRRGSGTIFFSHCTMACVYCQNYRFSRLDAGRETTVSELRSMMSDLSAAKCHNLNLVTPTHFLPPILAALDAAARAGVAMPLVWNTSGYESPGTLALLDGVVDIYLADLRYSDAEHAGRYSDAPDYVEMNRAALKEMHRQVGVLELGRDGVATRGLIVRHLVLPNDAAGTADTLRFVAEELSPLTYVSLMSQYYPIYRASDFPEIARPITEREWGHAREAMTASGIRNGWVQGYFGGDVSPMAGTEIVPD